MPTRRAQVRRNELRITPEAVQLFIASQKHAGVHSECTAGRCTSTIKNELPYRHCDECAHIEATSQLHRALGLKPWEAGPEAVSSDDRATWPPDGSAWAASLDQARELRTALEAAAKEQE